MTPRRQLRERSIKSLTHPIVIGAIIVLLLNDHWLRWHYPSWWTGKVGDFVWLIIAPFLFNLFISVVWPKNKIDQVGSIGFISTGLIFILGNTVPQFQQMIAWLFQQIVGWKPFMILDPTDLLMLPGLIVGWQIWQRNQESPRFTVFPLRKHFLGWILLAVSSVGTMANQPSFPDYGVYCVIEHEKTLLAITGDVTVSGVGWFESSDGGLTWIPFNENGQGLAESCSIRSAIPWQVSDLEHPNRLWRIQESEKFIEQSVDGGRSWQTAYTFPAGKEVRKYHYRPETPFLSSKIEPGGPYNGVVDPVTGNLIVSMGLEGVVVILPTGEAYRVNVGPYAFVEINELSLGQRLNTEFLLALILGMLVVCIGSLPVWDNSRKSSMFVIGVFGGTAVWLIYALFAREAGIIWAAGFVFFAYPGAHITIFSLIGWIFYLLLLGAAIEKIKEKHSWQLVRQLLETAVASFVLFLIPLIFWATGMLPSYQLSIVFGVVFATLPIRYIYRYVSMIRLNERTI